MSAYRKKIRGKFLAYRRRWVSNGLERFGRVRQRYMGGDL